MISEKFWRSFPDRGPASIHFIQVIDDFTLVDDNPPRRFRSSLSRGSSLPKPIVNFLAVALHTGLQTLQSSANSYSAQMREKGESLQKLPIGEAGPFIDALRDHIPLVNQVREQVQAILSAAGWSAKASDDVDLQKGLKEARLILNEWSNIVQVMKDSLVLANEQSASAPVNAIDTARTALGRASSRFSELHQRTRQPLSGLEAKFKSILHSIAGKLARLEKFVATELATNVDALAEADAEDTDQLRLRAVRHDMNEICKKIKDMRKKLSNF